MYNFTTSFINFVYCFILQGSLRDEVLDGRVKLMQDVVKTIRSMKQDYLPPKAKPDGT